ncbi:hypothetical protein [Alcaligenes sp. WGS1538]|uniref:hypothetical protein n=1 Tax=Alcaligenes sp. WGS1538 TaxID=3366811 RepID=UPI00372CFE1C
MTNAGCLWTREIRISHQDELTHGSGQRILRHNLEREALPLMYELFVVRQVRQAADTAVRMFAELLGKLDETAEIYAAGAERPRIAGLACESADVDA